MTRTKNAQGHFAWTVDDEQFVIDTSTTLTTQQQSDHLGMSYAAVKERRSLLRSQGRITALGGASSRLWTQEEDSDLKELIAEGYGIYSVVRKFRNRHNRTQPAIINRIDRLGGLDTLRAPRTILRIRSQDQTAELFGIDSHTVGIWIRQGWLKAEYSRRRKQRERKGGPKALITDAAILDFINLPDAWPAYTPDRITDRIWQEVAHEARTFTWVKARGLARAWGFAPQGFSRYINECAHDLRITTWGKAIYVHPDDVPVLKTWIDLPAPRPKRERKAA